jgi:chemosensory pili system protein ChpE
MINGDFMFILFFSALLLGFIFNAAPGAVFAETIRQGVRGGFKPALAVQIGSLVGDALWAVLGLAGVGLLLQLNFLRLPVGIAGVLYLLWLAWDAWQEANKEFSVKSSQTSTHHKKALRSGVLLSVTNPQNVAYWAALGSAMGAVGVTEPTASHYSIFFTGFMVSSCWTCCPSVPEIGNVLDTFNLPSLCNCLFTPCSFLPTKSLEFICSTPRL